MNYKSSGKLFSRYYVGMIMIVLLVGTFATIWTYKSVTANSKKDLLKEEEGRIKVYLKAPALEGRANEALVDFLAVHFNVRRSQIEIVKGLKSRQKVVNILNI